MTDKDFDAFKREYDEYPSQDNEGYVPDRGGFKCGWFTALRWERESNQERIKELEAKIAAAVEALHKIDDPMKYHHWEEDPYTRAGCFQFVAQEALKKIK